MRSLASVPVQKLFLVAVSLKVLLSLWSWWSGNLWVFGFILPLLVMTSYMLIGHRRQDTAVTDEKFADSCYYLGFIFTITSIILSLLDLPHIDAKMADIAIRFGAAMVSTVLGLAARVYLVSFKPDVQDAIQNAEAGVLEASDRLREQLTLVVEKLKHFEESVDEAARSTVARVSVTIEEQTQSYGTQLQNFFAALTQENERAFKAALEEVSAASLRLAQSVDGYSQSLKGNLTSIEAKVTHFSEAVTRRLEQTTFPDDYFAKRLAGPLEQLSNSSQALATGISTTSEEVVKSLAILRQRSQQVDGALERVVELATTQENLLSGTQAQVETLGILTSTLRSTQTGLDSLQDALKSQSAEQHKQTLAAEHQVDALTKTVGTLLSLAETLQKAEERLGQQQQSLSVVASKTSSQNDHLGELTPGLRTLTRELQKLSTSMEQHLAGLADMGQRMVQVETLSADGFAETRGTLQDIAHTQRELPQLGQTMHQLSTDMGQVCLRLQSVESAMQLKASANRLNGESITPRLHPFDGEGAGERHPDNRP